MAQMYITCTLYKKFVVLCPHPVFLLYVFFKICSKHILTIATKHECPLDRIIVSSICVFSQAFPTTLQYRYFVVGIAHLGMFYAHFLCKDKVFLLRIDCTMTVYYLCLVIKINYGFVIKRNESPICIHI